MKKKEEKRDEKSCSGIEINLSHVVQGITRNEKQQISIRNSSGEKFKMHVYLVVPFFSPSISHRTKANPNTKRNLFITRLLHRWSFLVCTWFMNLKWNVNGINFEREKKCFSLWFAATDRDLRFPGWLVEGSRWCKFSHPTKCFFSYQKRIIKSNEIIRAKRIKHAAGETFDMHTKTGVTSWTSLSIGLHKARRHWWKCLIKVCCQWRITFGLDWKIVFFANQR